MTNDEKQIVDILISLSLRKEDIIGLAFTIKTLGIQEEMSKWLEKNNEHLKSESVVDAQSAIVSEILRLRK